MSANRESGRKSSAFAGVDVLIVNPDSFVCGYFERILGRLGVHSVETVATGADGLQAIAEQSFDIVLTELDLEGLSGIDLLQALKDEPNAPAIVITAGIGRKDQVKEAIRLGVTSYLVKPFKQGDVEARLADIARSRRMHSGEGSDGDGSKPVTLVVDSDPAWWDTVRAAFGDEQTLHFANNSLKMLAFAIRRPLDCVLLNPAVTADRTPFFLERLAAGRDTAPCIILVGASPDSADASHKQVAGVIRRHDAPASLREAVRRIRGGLAMPAYRKVVRSALEQTLLMWTGYALELLDKGDREAPRLGVVRQLSKRAGEPFLRVSLAYEQSFAQKLAAELHAAVSESSEDERQKIGRESVEEVLGSVIDRLASYAAEHGMPVMEGEREKLSPEVREELSQNRGDRLWFRWNGSDACLLAVDRLAS